MIYSVRQSLYGVLEFLIFFVQKLLCCLTVLLMLFGCTGLLLI